MRHLPRWLTAALTAVALLATTACASSTDGSAGGASTAGSDAFPVTVGSLTLDQRPERIVSLSPTATEMLFAVDAGAQVVAVDEFSTYPSTAPRTTLSGVKPNVEAISGYDPDLVVISNDMEQIVARLQTLQIPTLLAPAAKNLDETYQQILDIGRLTGHTATAQALVERMRREIGAILSGLPRRDRPLTYFYELDTSYYTLTSATFVGTLLASAGLVNIADPAGTGGNAYPRVSAEVIVDANPDLIFLADAECCGQSADTVAKRSGWAGITAVRTGQVISLDGDIASRWGPRVVDLMRAIGAAVAAVPEG